MKITPNRLNLHRYQLWEELYSNGSARGTSAGLLESASLSPKNLFSFPLVFLLYAVLVVVIPGCHSDEKVKEKSLSVNTERIEKQDTAKNKPVIEKAEDKDKWKNIRRLEEMIKKNPVLWKERHRLGVSYMMSGKYQEAIEEFLAVLSLVPNNLHTLQSLGMVYFKMGKNHKALFYWRSALDINPESKLIWSLIQKIDTDQESKNKNHKSEDKDRDASIKKWAEYYKKGQKYYQEKKYEKAVEEFRAALKYNASDTRTHFSIGVAYNAMNKMKEAIDAWRESLKLKPDDIMVMRLISMAKKKLEREAEILKAKEAVKKKPEDSDLHYKLARLYLDDKHGRFIGEANTELKEAVRINSGNADAYNLLAEISFYKDKYIEGIEYLKKSGVNLTKENVTWKRVKAMELYQKLYQKGKDKWNEDGIEEYDDMVLVPEGEFVMGSDKGDPQANPNEVPKRRINLKPFYIDKYEVTNAQYKRFLNRFPKFPAPRHWRKGKFTEGRDNYPVVNIDWYMASSYCRSSGIRLPTEEEWEKAARGANGAIYPWGKTFNSEWVNSVESEFKKLTPAGSFEQGVSTYGVHDMSGSVWEWTSSGMDVTEDDNGGKNSPIQKNYKIRRGGSFLSEQKHLRGARRVHAFPTHTDRDVGFRCAKDK